MGSFSFDPINQAVERQGQTIALTPKATAILSCLVENAGRLVTHEQLLDHVWPDTFVQPEAIKVYIFELRRALGDAAKSPNFIESVARRGYRLKIPPAVSAGAESVGETTRGRKQLFGRKDESRVIDDCFARARDGVSQVVCVSGEAGIGKTALVEAFLERIQGTGLHLTKGQCVRIHGEQEPYYPLLEALGKLRVEGFQGALTRYAPTWAIQMPALFGPGQRELLRNEVLGATAGRMLREICELLENFSQAIPLVFVLEDVHWADAATVDFLSVLAQRRGSARLLTICTVRPIDQLPQGHPLRRVSRELAAKALWSHIAMPPLDHEAVHQMVVQELGEAPCSEDMVRRVAGCSGGNPLFVGSIVQRLRSLGDEGGRADEDLWGTPALQASDDLQGLLLSQFLELDSAERQVLEFASVAGSAFSAGDIAALAGLTAAEAETCMEGLAGTTAWVRPSPDGGGPDPRGSVEFKFTHDLYRDVVYRQIGRGRRALAHRRLAEDLENAGAEEQAFELAWRYHECGDPEKTVHYLMLAAQQAIERFALREAEGLLTKALALVRKFPDGEPKTEAQIEVLLQLVRAQSMYGGASDSREELISAASAAGRWDLAAMTAIDHLMLVASRKPSRCLVEADRAVALAARSNRPAQWTEAELFRSYLRLVFQPPDLAGFETLLKAVLQFRSKCPPEREAHAGWLCSQLQEDTADYTASIKSGRAARVAAAGRNDYMVYELASRHLRWHLFFAGRWREFLMECDFASKTAARNGAPVYADVVRIHRAYLYLECFDYDPISDIVENTTPARDFMAHKLAALRSMVCVGTGRAELALRTATEGLRIGGGYIEFRNRWMLGNARIEALLANHQLADAQSEAETQLGFVNSTLERTYQALTRELAARIRLAGGDLTAACDEIGAGLEIIHAYDLPLADWKVAATASIVYHTMGRRTDAGYQRNRGLAGIRKLSRELEAEPGLQQKFETGAMKRLCPETLVRSAS